MPKKLKKSERFQKEEYNGNDQIEMFCNYNGLNLSEDLSFMLIIPESYSPINWFMIGTDCQIFEKILIRLHFFQNIFHFSCQSFVNRIGNLTVNVLPFPSLLSTSMEPRWCFIIE